MCDDDSPSYTSSDKILYFPIHTIGLNLACKINLDYCLHTLPIYFVESEFANLGPILSIRLDLPRASNELILLNEELIKQLISDR